MTKQREKQLKNGDEVFVKAVFESLASDGDAYARYFWHNSKGERVSGLIAVTFDSVLLRSDLQQPEDKPKYDPSRLFREGDKVKYTPRNGRDFFNAPFIYDAAEVIEDEYRSGAVVVRFTFNYAESAVYNVPWYYLQLVTPVEELEPYSVEGDEDEWNIWRGGKCLMSFPFDSSAYYTEEQAKAAAEAECARLNAKHRKKEA